MSKPAVALFRKELRITRLFWAPTAFSFGVFLLIFMDNVWVYLATGACLAFVAAAAAAAIDDYYRADPFFAALPGTRGGLVLGRYLAWGAVIAASAVYFLALTALFHAILGPRAARLGSFVSLKGAAAFLAGALLAGLVFLPFQFRLGFWRGIWAFTAAGLVLSVVGLNIIARLVPAEACAAAMSPAFPGPLVLTGRGLQGLAWLIDSFMGRPEIVAAAAAIIAVLVYVSFRLSVHFYEKRDL